MKWELVKERQVAEGVRSHETFPFFHLDHLVTFI